MKFNNFSVGDRVIYTGPTVRIMNSSSDLINPFLFKGDVGTCIGFSCPYTGSISVRFLKECSISETKALRKARWLRYVTITVLSSECELAPIKFQPREGNINHMYIGDNISSAKKGTIAFITKMLPERKSALFNGNIEIPIKDLLCVEVDTHLHPIREEMIASSMLFNYPVPRTHVVFMEGIYPLICDNLSIGNNPLIGNNLSGMDSHSLLNHEPSVRCQNKEFGLFGSAALNKPISDTLKNDKPDIIDEIDPDMPELETIPEIKPVENEATEVALSLLTNHVNKKCEKLKDDLKNIKQFLKLFMNGNYDKISKEMAEQTRQILKDNKDFYDVLGISDMNIPAQFCLACIVTMGSTGQGSVKVNKSFDERIHDLIVSPSSRFIMADLLGLNREIMSRLYNVEDECRKDTISSVTDEFNGYVKYCLLKLDKLPKISNLSLNIDYEVAEAFYSCIYMTTHFLS